MAKMFYTLEETAERLQTNEEGVRSLAAEGRLQQFRDRQKLMFKRDQVDELAIEDQPGRKLPPRPGPQTPDDRWREEIEKYLPQLTFMSFAGPKATIKWLFQQVELNPVSAQLAERMRNAKTAEEQIEAAFPGLRVERRGDAALEDKQND